MTHPGLGSGALREHDAWLRAMLKERIQRMEKYPHHTWKNQTLICFDDLLDVIANYAPLSLSSPIEPRERELESLIVHMWVHSGYTKNGYQQMTTPQKALYDSLIGRSEEIAERDMPQTAVMRERAQASSEIREARLQELDGVEKHLTQHPYGASVRQWIKERRALLAPSRQGAGKKS